MPKFLDVTDQPTYGIGICDRCSRKMPLAELLPDPNSPGLRVCVEDRDEFDPYRLPPKQPDQINLPFYRPDTPMTFSEEAMADATTPVDWTPTIEGESVSGTITLGGDATYTKLGALVQVNFQMVATVSVAASGDISIGGLPYSIDTIGYGVISLDNDTYPVQLSAGSGDTFISIHGLGASPLTAATITSGMNISFLLTYLTGE